MRIALIQTTWHSNPEDTRKALLFAVEECCKEHKPDFLCLPEFMLGPAWYMPGQDRLRGFTDEPIPGRTTNQLRELAKSYGVTIIGGSIVEPENALWYNTCPVISSEGLLRGKTRKVHTFANEAIHCASGEQFDIYEGKFGQPTFGVAVCSDFWILESIRHLRLAGAKIIFVPGGSLRQNLDTMIEAMRVTAFINDCILVYCGPVGSLTGERNGRKVHVEFAGTSIIASPQGVLEQGSADREECLVVDLSDDEINELGQERANSLAWQSLLPRTPEAYSGLLKDYIGKDRDLVAELKGTTSTSTDSLNSRKHVG